MVKPKFDGQQLATIPQIFNVSVTVSTHTKSNQIFDVLALYTITTICPFLIS